MIAIEHITAAQERVNDALDNLTRLSVGEDIDAALAEYEEAQFALRELHASGLRRIEGEQA